MLNESVFIAIGQFDQKRNFKVVLPGHVFYHDRPRSGSSQSPYISGAIMPLHKHGSGRPLINDEAFALSHTRILSKGHPGLPLLKPK
jgi:hypothetical protein